MKRVSIDVIVLLVAAVAAFAAEPADEGAARPEIGPYLQFPADPAKGSVTIVWETAAPTEGWVEYGVAPQGEKVASRTAAQKAARHEVTLKDLHPGTGYFYRLRGEVAGSGSFVIPDAAKKSVRFAVFGDSRAYDDATLKLIARVEADRPEFLIGTGDYVNTAGEGANWKEFFDSFGALISRVAVFPAVGNHDVGYGAGAGGYRHYFLLPEGRLYYSFNWGRCHFVALDLLPGETIEPRSEEYKWLERDLASAAEADFIFVYFHQPMRNCGMHGTEDAEAVEASVLPLLEKFGVEASFAGHEHNYQHWVLGRHTHVVTGGFCRLILYPIDQDLRKKGLASGELKEALSVPHYVLVEVEDGRATITAKDAAGKAFDKCTIESRKKTRTK